MNKDKESRIIISCTEKFRNMIKSKASLLNASVKEVGIKLFSKWLKDKKAS